MVNLICGTKGSGKTKRIIDLANTDSVQAKGDCIFITDTDRYNFDIDQKVAVINVARFALNNQEKLLAFIQGVASAKLDLTHLYIDGAHRICKKTVEELTDFYLSIKTLSENNGFNVYATASIQESDLPDALKNL